MSDTTPHSHHSEDARADDGPPTDGFTDDVRTESAEADDDATDSVPDESTDIPAEDLAAAQDMAGQPDTQGADPLSAELGEDGQGDLGTEDDPQPSDSGPTDLRISDS